MTHDLTTDLIDTSFLSDAEKQQLTERLAVEGPTDAFYKAFDAALADEIKKRGHAYKSAMGQFNQQVAVLEAEITATKEKHKKKVAEILLDTPLIDTPKRQQLLNEYKAKLAELTIQYGQGVNAIVQAVTKT